MTQPETDPIPLALVAARALTQERIGMKFDIDADKVDQAVLALLYLGLHDRYRAWKGFDWAAMGRLHDKGYITDPVGSAKSVLFTEEGLRESVRLLSTLVSRHSGS